MKHGTVSMYTTGKCRCQDCKDARNAYMREYRRSKKVALTQGEIDSRNKDNRVVYRLKKRHNRGGQSECACCGGEFEKLALDHDHETEEFRGWICHGCNVGLGNLGDNEAGVLRAIAYLKSRVV